MLLRVFKYGAKNTLRNKFLSFSSILVLGLLMFFINILLVVHNVGFKIMESVNNKLTISLYLDENYTRTSIEVIDLIQDINKFSPSIGIEYVTKEQALEIIEKRDPKLVQILEKKNPLPETINISNIKIDDFDKINAMIESKLYILDHNSDQIDEKGDTKYSYVAQYERISKVTITLKALQVGLYIIIWVFLVSISVIVYSIIWNFIYYYKDEIYITRLVWGSSAFVHGPFIFQWIFYNFVAFLLSTLLFFILLKNLSFLFSDGFQLDFLFENYIILFLELVLFLLIGWVSGYYSSKRYITSSK